MKSIPIPLKSGGTAVLELPYLLDATDYDWLIWILGQLRPSMTTAACIGCRGGSVTHTCGQEPGEVQP